MASKSKIDWLMGGKYREVPGFSDYFVSREGEIIGPSGIVMKQGTMKIGGYKYVLCDRRFNGIRNQRKLFVHRAVLLAFVGSPREGQETRHLDNDTSHNYVENLAWGTRLENSNDRRIAGTIPRGFSHFRTKVTSDIIRAIYQLMGKLSSRKAGKLCGVGKGTVQDIWNKKRWTEVTDGCKI